MPGSVIEAAGGFCAYPPMGVAWLLNEPIAPGLAIRAKNAGSISYIPSVLIRFVPRIFVVVFFTV